MSLTRAVAIGLLIGGFIAAKVYVFLRPAGYASAILGAIILIFSEPAEAK